MKKLTALFTIVALLVCMFTFAPTASAVDLPNYTGEYICEVETLSNQIEEINITMEATCFNGWADESMGVDYVEGVMTSDTYLISGTCVASVEVSAQYIVDGAYEYEYDSDEQDYMYAGSGLSVSVYPNTTYLSSGTVSFYINAPQYGGHSETIYVSCPASLK